jgi:hypothetical protein
VATTRRSSTPRQLITGLVREDAEVKRGETARGIKSFKEGLDWLLGEARGGIRHPALQGALAR